MRILGFVAVAVLSGCAIIPKGIWPGGTGNSYVSDVVIDGLASPGAKSAASYIVLPGNENVTTDDLQFQEFAEYIKRGLANRGYSPAESADAANVAVVVHYGIGEPQTAVRTYTLPVWGQTGVASTYSSGTVRPTYGGGVSYSGTTYNTPQYGVTGSTTHVQTATYFNRYAVITAYDFQEFRKSQRQVQVWKTTITSAGTNSDLRVIFPMMIGAALPYLAENTGQKVKAQIGDQDDALKVVKGLPITP